MKPFDANTNIATAPEVCYCECYCYCSCTNDRDGIFERINLRGDERMDERRYNRFN